MIKLVRAGAVVLTGLLSTAEIRAADDTFSPAAQPTPIEPAPSTLAEPLPPTAATDSRRVDAKTRLGGTIDLQRSAPAPRACEPDPDEAGEGSGSFFLGEGLFDISALNQRLANNGYERLSAWSTLIGGEGRAVFKSGFVAGVHGGALVNPGGDGPNGMSTHFSGGFGALDFGFALVQARSLLITLTGDVGGYGLSLGISSGQSLRFDDVLAEPRQAVSLGRGGVLLGLTLGLDGRVPIGKVERGRRGFFQLGARLGGLFGPALGGWSLADGGQASHAPSTGLVGGYLALAIGFGGGRERRLP